MAPRLTGSPTDFYSNFWQWWQPEFFQNTRSCKVSTENDGLRNYLEQSPIYGIRTCLGFTGTRSTHRCAKVELRTDEPNEHWLKLLGWIDKGEHLGQLLEQPDIVHFNRDAATISDPGIYFWRTVTHTSASLTGVTAQGGLERTVAPNAPSLGKRPTVQIPGALGVARVSRSAIITCHSAQTFDLSVEDNVLEAAIWMARMLPTMRGLLLRLHHAAPTA